MKYDELSPIQAHGMVKDVTSVTSDSFYSLRAYLFIKLLGTMAIVILYNLWVMQRLLSKRKKVFSYITNKFF